jgi:alanine dehydrogenase
MRVGCPKEIKNHEYRVGLTPGSVREYTAHGHEVLVETGAGAGIGADPLTGASSCGADVSDAASRTATNTNPRPVSPMRTRCILSHPAS